jgi:HSP20 family protein
MARRGPYSPSLISISPLDIFAASPFELMRRFSEEMDQVFGDLGLTSRGALGSPLASAGQMTTWAPAIEVFEREGNLVVRAELPGLKKEDVKIEVSEDGLIIQGERKQEHEERREGFYRSERNYGRFYRLIPLPDDIDVEQVRAQFDNGVLEVNVPVPQRRERRREISIGGGDQPQAASAKQT